MSPPRAIGRCKGLPANGQRPSVAFVLSSPPHFVSCCARVTRSSTPLRWCHHVGRSGSTPPMQMWCICIGYRVKCSPFQTSAASASRSFGPFTTCGLSVVPSTTQPITVGVMDTAGITARTMRMASISTAGPGSVNGNIGDGPCRSCVPATG